MRLGGASARRCCPPCPRRELPSSAEASRCPSLQHMLRTMKSSTGLLHALHVHGLAGLPKLWAITCSPYEDMQLALSY